jgi:hypothetical protein
MQPGIAAQVVLEAVMDPEPCNSYIFLHAAYS